jgi:cysteine desulfurase family protein
LGILLKKTKNKKTKHQIYLDCAATTRYKPPQVYKAVLNYATQIGVSHSRGTYQSGIAANQMIYELRSQLAKLFQVPRSERILFTKNATEALNMALKGYLQTNDHVILSSLEHNAVIRPLNQLKKERAIEYTMISANSQGRLNPYEFEKAIQPKTKLICLVHASNVTGTINPVEEVGNICSKHGIAFLVDATQTAGSVPINVQTMKIDFLAFTGHKSLMGPPGTGGLIVSPQIKLNSFLEGGTGSNSDKEEQPEIWPDKFESGTLNYWGLSGLKAGVDFILKKGVATIRLKEEQLVAYFLSELKALSKIRIYGLPSGLEHQRVPIVSLNIEGQDPSAVGYELDQNYQIMVRVGLHCAPLAHRTIGSYPQGTIRFSFGYYNTVSDIRKAVEALKIISAFN